MEHTLIVAGIGPGSKEYILPKALYVIEKARYLVGGHRALSDYGHAGQEMYPITGKLSLLADWMESALKKDDVVVMVSGDPRYFSYAVPAFPIVPSVWTAVLAPCHA